MKIDVMVHKHYILCGKGGGGKGKKVSIKEALENNPWPMTDREGMDTLLIVVSIVGRTRYGVAGPFGS